MKQGKEGVKKKEQHRARLGAKKTRCMGIPDSCENVKKTAVPFRMQARALCRQVMVSDLRSTGFEPHPIRALVGRNSGTGTDTNTGRELFGSFFGTTVDFEITLFDYDNYNQENPGAPAGNLPVNFAQLEAGPSSIVSLWRDNFYGTFMAETAGANGQIAFSELGLSGEESLFVEGGRYSILDDGIFL